ncbi:hypothetical protein D3C85_785660 [compost metagenome]
MACICHRIPRRRTPSRNAPCGPCPGCRQPPRHRRDRASRRWRRRLHNPAACRIATAAPRHQGGRPPAQPSAAGHWQSRHRSLPPVPAGSGQRPVPPDRPGEYCPPIGRAWCPGSGPCRNRDRTARPWPESAAPRPKSARCAPASAGRIAPSRPESAAWRARSRVCLPESPAARFPHRRCKHQHRHALPYRRPDRCRRHWRPGNRSSEQSAARCAG